MELAKKTTFLLIIGNTILFILKLAIGLISNSVAIISDAINSFTDIITSFVIFVCVKFGRRKADSSHPFGHHRIEPIAGLIVAIFIAIVGVEVINFSIRRLISGEPIIFSYFIAYILLFTIIIKAFMYFYIKKVCKKINSPALHASSVDCRNDVFISGAALLGIICYNFGYTYIDSIVGIIIGIWIIFSGYEVGKSNIDFLIGRSPNKKSIEEIKKTTLSIKGVKGFNDLRAHYVGNYVHVEIHIELDKKLSLVKAHDIGKQVELKLEELPWINKAFIHIDPV